MNVHLFRMINDLGKEYTFLNPAFIFLAEYMVLGLGAVVLIFWFTRNDQNRMMIICAVGSFGLAEVIGKIAGKLYSNHQPFAELAHVNQLIDKAVNNSFPSDHTILFFSFCVTFSLFRKSWGWVWIGLALLVGISRIWVGVHYPGDVLAGTLISIFSAVIVSLVVPRLRMMKNLLAFYNKVEQSLLPTKSKTKGM